MKVLDLGCGIDGRSFEDYVPSDWQITGIDILEPEKNKTNHPNFRYVQQNARDLSRFRNQEFDLTVSIGMLEHVTEETAYREIVAGILRVSRQYIVVVPYRYSWIEPHYVLPFFPIYPYGMKLALVKLLNLSGQRKVLREDPAYIKRYYVWRSNAEYAAAFPGSKVYMFPTLEQIAIVKSCLHN